MATTAKTSPSVANSLSSPGSGDSGVSGALLAPGWEVGVLNLIGAPPSATNISFLDAWQKTEGGGTANNAAFNPLNVTGAIVGNVNTYGTGSINSVGVQAYASPVQGVVATANFLKFSNYTSILAALRSGNAWAYTQQNTSDIVKELSTWGSSGFASEIASGSAGSGIVSSVEGVIGKAAGAAVSSTPGLGSVISAGGDVISGANSVASATSSVESFLGDLTNPNEWIRILEVVAGIALVGIGLILVASEFGIISKGSKVAETAASVALPELELSQAFAQGQRAGRVTQARAAGRRESRGSGPRESSTSVRQRERRERLQKATSKMSDDIPF